MLAILNSLIPIPEVSLGWALFAVVCIYGLPIAFVVLLVLVFFTGSDTTDTLNAIAEDEELSAHQAEERRANQLRLCLPRDAQTMPAYQPRDI